MVYIKLLKKYVNEFDLDVFEAIFINASEDSVQKKYAYIKLICIFKIWIKLIAKSY